MEDTKLALSEKVEFTLVPVSSPHLKPVIFVALVQYYYTNIVVVVVVFTGKNKRETFCMLLLIQLFDVIVMLFEERSG